MNILNAKFDSDEEDDDYIPVEGKCNNNHYYIDKDAKNQKNGDDNENKSGIE